MNYQAMGNNGETMQVKMTFDNGSEMYRQATIIAGVWTIPGHGVLADSGESATDASFVETARFTWTEVK